MVSSNLNKAIREFMQNNPEFSYTKTLRMAEKEHYYMFYHLNDGLLTDRQLCTTEDEESDFETDELLSCDSKLNEDEYGYLPFLTFAELVEACYQLICDEPELVLPSLQQANIDTTQIENGSISEDFYGILEFVKDSEGNYYIWKRHSYSAGLLPGWEYACALHSSVVEWKFQEHVYASDRNQMEIYLQDNIEDDPTIPAEKALNEYLGNDGDNFMIELGFDQLPDECLALVAHFLLGKYDYWTQTEYDRMTFAYRSSIGKLHPDDADLVPIRLEEDNISMDEFMHLYNSHMESLN